MAKRKKESEFRKGKEEEESYERKKEDRFC